MCRPTTLFWFDLEDQPSQNVSGEFRKRILLSETSSALSFGSRHSSTYPSGEWVNLLLVSVVPPPLCCFFLWVLSFWILDVTNHFVCDNRLIARMDSVVVHSLANSAAYSCLERYALQSLIASTRYKVCKRFCCGATCRWCSISLLCSLLSDYNSKDDVPSAHIEGICLHVLKFKKLLKEAHSLSAIKEVKFIFLADNSSLSLTLSLILN